MENIGISVSLLAGGNSSRMGTNKALLTFEGKTFIERLIEEFNSYDEILLSAKAINQYENLNVRIVPDKNQDSGPLEGLCRVLSESKNDFVFVCACDMPFASKKIIEYLKEFFCSDFQIYVPVVDGKLEPLCAVYKKSVLPFIENQIEKKDFKISHLFESVPTKFVRIEKSALKKKFFTNINTPGDYAGLHKPFVFCVSGLKNSGKTRMICALLSEAKIRGYTCAVIKHDGHDCFSDAPGTDTFYFTEHGAVATAVFSSRRYMFFASERTGVDLLIEKINFLSDRPDFIIIEGLKDSDYPKIEVMRKETGDKSVCKAPVIFVAHDDYDVKEIFNNIEEYFKGQLDEMHKN